MIYVKKRNPASAQKCVKRFSITSWNVCAPGFQKHGGRFWAASTFIEGFEFHQFRRVLQALPQDVGNEPIRHLELLEKRSLLHWSRKRWLMHSLIRQYSQDIFYEEFQAHYRYAHRKAGESYFPLTGKGWVDHRNRNARSRYGN